MIIQKVLINSLEKAAESNKKHKNRNAIGVGEMY